MDPGRLRILVDRVRLEVESGRLPSAQLAVARNGKLAHFESFGASSQRYLMQSVGRPIVASALWKLIGEGGVDLDATIASLIPEFDTNGKGRITVRHVLTHTAGIPFAPLGFPKMTDRAERIKAFAKWRLDWEPGSQLQFHMTSAAWLIAELVERADGRTLPDYIQQELAEPLGLGFELATPVERLADTVAPMVCTDGSSAEADPWGPWFFDRPEVIAAGEPAHAMVGSAGDLALFYQAVLEARLWTPEIIAEAIRPQITAVPAGAQIYGGGTKPASVGLFVMVAGESPDMWLPSVGSPRTFGHSGAAYQGAWGDPDSGVSFALLSNGYPMSGYDYSPRGVAMITNINNLAADVVA
ncbi:beta-lactamase family protein [Gordonia polyisoprenivorans]|nr:beta-lactamase family protein [Gordonia polyisoprenivorans]